MKLNFGSEAIMFIFILGFLFLTVIQPTFYSSYSTPPAGGPTSTPTPPGGGGNPPTATPTPPTAGTNPAFFTITPTSASIKKNETLTLVFTLNTGDFEIDGVDLVLSFESEFLETKSITPKITSLDYNEPVIDNNAGTVKISAAGRIQGGTVVGFKGISEYSEIEFLALETTNSTTISFTGGKNGCWAASAGTNRLDLTKCLPGNYQIK